MINAELAVRCSLLLRPGDQSAPSDIIAVDNMKINLATYQVYIDDEPVDLTLMEYSLLSFRRRAPGRRHRHRRRRRGRALRMPSRCR